MTPEIIGVLSIITLVVSIAISVLNIYFTKRETADRQSISRDIDALFNSMLRCQKRISISLEESRKIQDELVLTLSRIGPSTLIKYKNKDIN